MGTAADSGFTTPAGGLSIKRGGSRRAEEFETKETEDATSGTELEERPVEKGCLTGRQGKTGRPHRAKGWESMRRVIG